MSKKKKKKASLKVRVANVFWPIFIRPHTTTPKTSPETDGSMPGPAPAPPVPPAPPVSDSVRRSMAHAIHELKLAWRSGVLSETVPSWTGFSVPTPGTIVMRQGGPEITGPGFGPGVEPAGGVYDPKKSPGLGFRSELAWRVWRTALAIIEKDRTLTPSAIMQAAMIKTGSRHRLDSSEARLVEMGIEFFLGQPGIQLRAGGTDGSR